MGFGLRVTGQGGLGLGLMFGHNLSRGRVVYGRVGLAPGWAAPLAGGLVAVTVDAEGHGGGGHPRQLHRGFGRPGQFGRDGRQPARVPVGRGEVLA